MGLPTEGVTNQNNEGKEHIRHTEKTSSSSGAKRSFLFSPPSSSTFLRNQAAKMGEEWKTFFFFSLQDCNVSFNNAVVVSPKSDKVASASNSVQEILVLHTLFFAQWKSQCHSGKNGEKQGDQIFLDSHCLKVTQNVAFEFLNFGIFHQFLSY